MNAELLLEHFDRISEAPDAVVRLRRFILDLAVRGKLTEQDPNDEPAAELLKQIEAENARLVKEGRIKEPKELAPIAGNVPYELPASWQWVPLGVTVNSHLGGGTPSKNNSAYWGGEIPWASVKDIGKSKYVDDTIDRITESGLADSSSNLIAPGNLIVVTRMGLGKISINRVPIAINQDLRALSLSSLSAIEYFYNFFKTHGFEGSGLTVKGIKVEELLNTPFPLPPLAEQHHIVAKVDELMALCDQLEAAKNERETRRDRLVAASLHRIGTAPAAEGEAQDKAQIAAALRQAACFHLDHLPRLTTRPEHIKQLRQAILNLAVSGRLVPQDPADEPAAVLLKRIHEWRNEAIQLKQIRAPKKLLKTVDDNETLFTLPIGWEWARLGEIIYIRSGDGLTAANMKDGAIPVFGGNGINGYHNTHNVDEPTIVIGRVGYYCGSIHLTPSKAWVTDNAFVTHYFQKAIYQDFLLLLLKGTDLKESEKATAQPVISGSKVYPLVVGLPPLAEQHRIVAKVDELMALCGQLESQLATSEADSRRLLEAVLRDALAPALEQAA